MKRIHVHLYVSRLKHNIALYTQLFQARPSIEQEDHAKWMLDDPRITFTISQSSAEEQGIKHMGIEMEDCPMLQGTAFPAASPTFTPSLPAC